MMKDDESIQAGAELVIEKEFVVPNKYGLHARPAALFVKTTSQFSSDVLVEKDGAVVSGKSIMGLLTIEGHEGAALKVTVTGTDAKEVLAALDVIFDNKFGEE